MSYTTFVLWVSVVAVAVFAASGALAAAEKRLDIMAYLLFGGIAGIGGGTVRDILLNTQDVFWIEMPIYLHVCVIASALTYFVAPRLWSLQRAFLWMDAAGLALFSALGASKALAYGAPASVAIAMGMVTTTFGSLMRDILMAREPVLLGPEIYVTAALAGATGFTLLTLAGVAQWLSLLIAVTVAFALRACAILFDLRLKTS